MATWCWPNVYFGYVAYAKRNVIGNFYNGLFNLTQVFHVTQSTHIIFNQVHFNRVGTDIEVTVFDGFNHHHHTHIMGFHGCRVQVNLVLLHKTANGSHLRNTFC